MQEQQQKEKARQAVEIIHNWLIENEKACQAIHFKWGTLAVKRVHAATRQLSNELGEQINRWGAAAQTFERRTFLQFWRIVSVAAEGRQRSVIRLARYEAGVTQAWRQRVCLEIARGQEGRR